MQRTVITHLHSRRNRRRTAVIVLLCYCGSLLAAPGGGQIVGGSGTISQSGALTQIHQNSERLAIDWQRFDVAADERVQFLQPSSQAIALNRILDTKASTILGRVDANGKLFLVNPRGLVFGKGSVVNAAALVATDLDIDPNKFMEGNYHFAGDDSLWSSGVINQGAIEAAVGGSVTLLGTVISNEGQIRADQGSVNLVAANEVIVSFEPEGQVGLLVNRALLTNINGNASAASNSGEIIAAGGQVLLAGHVASDLYSQAVNNEGIIEATSMETGRGYIALLGEGATVTNSGELNVSGTGGAGGGEVRIMAGDIRNSGAIDASGSRGGAVYEQASVAVVHSQDSAIDATGSDGEGGTIELYGERVALVDTTQLDASGATGGGTILVGGDYQGAGDHRAQQTVVTGDVVMKADAIDTGDGGKVIVWSDDDTYFYGDIYARGGSQSGDGGFVEVSGKDNLQFVGYVNTSAANGAMGTLLLDPTTLNIVAGSGGTNNIQVSVDGEILAGEGGASFTIDEDTLEALTSNVTLEALQAINISSMSNGVLCFHCASEGGSGSGDVIFRVTGTSPGSITMDVNDRIEVANGNLTLQVSSAAGATLTLGDLMTTGAGGIAVNAIANSGGTTSGNVNLTVGDVTAASGSIALTASTTNTASVTVTSSGNATLTAGQITLNSGGNVTIDAISSSESEFDTADSGDVSVVTGAITINGAGNATIDATTDAFSTWDNATAGSSSISAGAINITGAGNIDLTSSANAAVGGFGGAITAGTMTLSSGGATNNGAGTITLTATDGITLAGNFAAGSAGNNGFFNATGDSITLAGDTRIVMRNDGSGASPIIFNTSGANSIDGGNFDLTLNPDQANFAINWANFVAGSINTLTLGHANNIYIVDGGAGVGDITFTQADLDSFTSLASGLGFDASVNVVIGNSSFNYGNVELTAGSAINVTGDVDPGTGNFNFTANAGTDFTMNVGTSINSGNGAIAIDAGGNIALTSLITTNATASAVAITSTGGAIIDGDTVDDVDITATSGSVNLIAANGIGDDATATDYTLEINAAGVSASNSTANNIDLDLTGNVTLDGALTNSAAGGGLLVNASTGSLTVDSALTTANGIIDLTANTTLTMNSGSAIDAGSATINLLAANDIVLTSLTTTNATASAVTVTSTGGAILDGDTVDDVDITATNGTVNLIAANGIGDDATATDYTLEINAADVNATNNTANNIDLDLAGDVTLDGSLANSAAGGGLLVNASTGSLTVDGALTTANGIIDLTANTALTMNAGSAIDAGSATINLLAANDIVLTSLTTTNATASAVTVTSTGGAILDGDTVDDVDITATSGTINLTAANGIGTFAAPLDLDTPTVIVSAGSGNVMLTNVGNLSVAGLDTTNGDVNVSAGGNLQLNGTVSTGNGGVTLAAATDITVNNSVTTANGNVQMDAGNHLTLAATGSVSAGGGDVALIADSGISDGVGALSIVAGGTVSGNDVSLQSAQTMSVTGIQGSSVTLTSGADIVDANSAALDITVTDSAGALTLNAVAGVGVGDALETDTRLLVLASDVAQEIANAGNVAVSGLGSHSGGDITVTTTGDLTLATAVITDSSALDLVAGGAVNAASLDSGGAVSVTATTLNVGSATVNSLTTAAATNVVTTLATTMAMATGNLSLATDASVTSGDVLSAGSLTLTNSGNATVTSVGGMTFTGINGTGSDLTLNSAADMTLGSVALGVGNFNAQVDSDANAVATLSAATVSAGNITLSGGADNNDVLQLNGQMNGNDISVSGFGHLDLQRIVALGSLSLQGQTLSLTDDLQSRNGLFVFGDTTLFNNISLDSTGAGAVSGSRLELEGNWSGSGFDLALNAGSHVACTTGASLSDIDSFSITDSIKTVMGQVSANSIDVRSSQEIHLNQSITANTVVFNADSNGDGIGLLSVLAGRSINTPSLTLVGSTVQATATTAADCDLPSGLPTIPNPQLDFRIIAEVVQEAERFKETALETFASNAPNVTYLDSSCHPNRRGTKMHHECALDESVRNFLGTFLIDFQLPTN